MEQHLLLSGERDHLTLVSFDDATKTLRVIGAWKSPFNVSWAEPCPSQDSIYRFLGISEGEESGTLFTAEIDVMRDTCNITSEKPTLGAPAHLTVLHDHSAVALSTYLGGSVALYPIIFNDSNTPLLTGDHRFEVLLEFPYQSVGHGLDPDRQGQCHPHQILEAAHGSLYAPDLGSDRVWVIRRSQMGLHVTGWLQCPPGTGPRHAVLNHDGTMLYVIGELSHNVHAFDLSNRAKGEIHPVEGFACNVIPPNVRPEHQLKMDSSEICMHPTISNVLYVSNRWERHILERSPQLGATQPSQARGDAIAVLVLSDDGRSVDNLTWVRTRLDVIRGMRMANEGQFMVVCGQEGGGIEVYKVGGLKGDDWQLLCALEKGLERGIKHAIWL